MSHFATVFDACVLHPAELRDFLMWLARARLFRAKRLESKEQICCIRLSQWTSYSMVLNALDLVKTVEFPRRRREFI